MPASVLCSRLEGEGCLILNSGFPTFSHTSKQPKLVIRKPLLSAGLPSALIKPQKLPAVSAMASVTSTSSGKRAIIRFLSINDVYELENLPRFAAAVREVGRHLSCRDGRAGRRGQREGRREGKGWTGSRDWLCVCIGLVPDVGKPEARTGRLFDCLNLKPTHKQYLSYHITDKGGSAERRGRIGRECGDQGAGSSGG